MKELNIKVGDLYEFILAQGGKPEAENSLFIDVPFELQIQDESGRWISSSKVFKKEDAIYEVTFKTPNGKEKIGKYAADHIFPIDLEKELSGYCKDLSVGDILPGGFEVLSIKKIKDKDFVYSPQADSESHNYKDVDGIIHHNTYSVTHTLEEKGLRKNKDTENACTGSHEYCYAKGSIGKAITPVTLFFYRHKDDNLIVLDDCDAFLTEALRNDQLSNFFKALFENEVEPVPGQAGRSQSYVNVSPTVAKLVNKYIANTSRKEESGSHLAINKDRLLNEHVFEVTVNGQKFEEKLDENEFENLIGKNASRQLKEKAEKRFEKREVLSRRKLFNEAIGDDDFDGQDEYGDIEFDGMIAGDLETLSGGFYYKPCTIIVSNLSSADLPDAVESRFNIVNLTLTPEEFLCRAEKILGSLQLAQGSTFAKDELDFYKKQVHGALKHVITAIDKGIPIDNGKVPIRNKALQFRIYNDLVGLYAYEEDVWLEKHDPKEELQRAYASLKSRDPAAAERLRTLKTAKEVAAYFIQPIFVKRDLIPYLRAADKEKKR